MHRHNVIGVYWLTHSLDLSLAGASRALDLNVSLSASRLILGGHSELHKTQSQRRKKDVSNRPDGHLRESAAVESVGCGV